jgi:hypothetical protein
VFRAAMIAELGIVLRQIAAKMKGERASNATYTLDLFREIVSSNPAFENIGRNLESFLYFHWLMNGTLG